MVDAVINTNDEKEKEKLIEEGIIPPIENEEVVVLDVPPDEIVTNIEEVVESMAPVVEEIPAPVVVDPTASVIPPPLPNDVVAVPIPDVAPTAPVEQVPEKFKAALMRLGELELGKYGGALGQYVDYSEYDGTLYLKIPIKVISEIIDGYAAVPEITVTEAASESPKTYAEFKERLNNKGA